jgi:membrane protein required for colicin V production
MHWSQWMFLDYVVAAIILISTVVAFAKGLVREIVSLVALIGGFLLAAFYYPVLGGRLSEFCRTDTIANFVAFLGIFLGCLLIGAVISSVINRFLKAASLQWIDHLLGGVFGLLRGWAIASVLVLGLIAFPIRENPMTRSFLAPYLLAGAQAAVLLVPQSLKEQFNEQYQKLLQKWNQNGGAQ